MALTDELERSGAVAIERFWRGVGARSPMIEAAPDSPNERVVTFLWRDANAAEVLLFVNRLTDERNLDDSLMRRVPGTDVWHLSYRMRADWRASYCFLPRAAGERPAWRDPADQITIRSALDGGLADPRNPEVTHNRLGAAHSVVSLPDAPQRPRLTGPVDSLRAPEEFAAPEGHRVWVHRTGDRPATERLPVVVLLDGEVWSGPQELVPTLDGLTAEGLIPPTLFLFVDSGGRDLRWRELGGDDAASYVVERLLPWAVDHAGASADPDGTVVVGQSLGGLTALRCGILHPERVGRVLSQSASLWREDLTDAVDAAPGLAALHAYVEVGAQEWVLRQPNRDLADRLGAAGARTRFVEYNGGHDYACWAIGIVNGLVELLRS